jgi:hypothetical protein
MFLPLKFRLNLWLFWQFEKIAKNNCLHYKLMEKMWHLNESQKFKNNNEKIIIWIFLRFSSSIIFCPYFWEYLMGISGLSLWPILREIRTLIWQLVHKWPPINLAHSVQMRNVYAALSEGLENKWGKAVLFIFMSWFSLHFQLIY